MKVYGEDLVKKADCVKHVAKRLGTALRNARKRSQYVKLGRGEGRGRLTDSKIAQMTGYYSSAIKKNIGNVEAMWKAITAILLHSMSNDESHSYQQCPQGVSSWCYHNRQLAAGAEQPKVPDAYLPIPKEVGMQLLPIFNRPSSPELLQ